MGSDRYLEQEYESRQLGSKYPVLKTSADRLARWASRYLADGNPDSAYELRCALADYEAYVNE